MGKQRGFTIPELIITIVIVAILLGYAWSIYFSGRETMRQNVSQSHMQNETRIFFDHLTQEIAQAYRFLEIDGENTEVKKFSFYSFQFFRAGLDRIYYNEATAALLPPNDQKFDVVKYEYVWNKKDKTLKKSQTGGFLYFLRRPMTFEVGPVGQYEGSKDVAFVNKIVLKSLDEFELKGYEQNYKSDAPDNEPPYTLREIHGNGEGNASSATFLVLHVHNKIDEVGSRRDEEVDLVGKFYSRARLADAAYPGYFGSVDDNDRY